MFRHGPVSKDAQTHISAVNNNCKYVNSWIWACECIHKVEIYIVFYMISHIYIQKGVIS